MADNREVHTYSNENNDNISHIDQNLKTKTKLNEPSLSIKKRKFERFDIPSNNSAQSWHLPDELNYYATKAINRYLPEKDVQENIEDCLAQILK